VTRNCFVNTVVVWWKLTSTVTTTLPDTNAVSMPHGKRRQLCFSSERPSLNFNVNQNDGMASWKASVTSARLLVPITETWNFGAEYVSTEYPLP